METSRPGEDMCACEEQGVDALAAEILRYLHSHSTAADTTEGIARWWINRQRIEDTVTRVQSALDRLVAQAQVEPRLIPGGMTLYLLRQGDDSPAGDSAGQGV
jgi:hypothetical protein